MPRLSPRRAPRAIPLVALVGIAMMAVTGCGPKNQAATPARNAPNVLILLSDDQAVSTFRPSLMPETFRWIVRPGTQFHQGIAAPPLCCPDRAGILTGQYPHNHGVFKTAPGYGALVDPDSTLPAWLQNGGYTTALVGKFLNRYDRFAGTGPAPGFDEWFQLREPESYYDFQVSDNGTLRSYGDDPSDYSTRLLTRRARSFIAGQKGAASPFFLLMAYHAPHLDAHSNVPGCESTSAVPPSYREERRYLDVPFPKTKAFNERNVSDKPDRAATAPRLTPKVIRHREAQWHCALAADGTLDRSVGALMRQLKDDGQLRDTIVFYLSDNGFLYGEHRLEGKSQPYEPSLRVPYAVRLPYSARSSTVPASSDALVTNQDVAPTILDLAGLPACTSSGDCRRMDGRSLVPLLHGNAAHFRRRRVLVQINAKHARYQAVRTPSSIYVHYKSGAQEYYDLRRDPQELRNAIHQPGSSRQVAALKRAAHKLRRCSGIRGREPREPGVPFCG